MAYHNKLRSNPAPVPKRAPNEDELRGSGRTTALALHSIASAIRCPGQPVVLRDHHGSTSADRSLLRVAQDIVATLDLKHMTFNDVQNTVRCDVLEWVA